MVSREVAVAAREKNRGKQVECQTVVEVLAEVGGHQCPRHRFREGVQ
jgi:hypothetical protein